MGGWGRKCVSAWAINGAAIKLLSSALGRARETRVAWCSLVPCQAVGAATRARVRGQRLLGNCCWRQLLRACADYRLQLNTAVQLLYRTSAVRCATV